MEWYLVALIIFGSLVLLMASGVPIAFCFLLINMVGVFIFWSGETGLQQWILSIFRSLATFGWLPLPLFVLMGEVMFHSEIAPRMIDTVDEWLGRLPGRLSLVAVGGASLFSTLSGDSLATTTMLGTVLTPEMEKRGYKKPMSIGPILGAGGLAMMIPPSFYAVFLGIIAEVSIGRLLVAIIIPGLLMAALYATYIITRCYLQPSIAPVYEVPPIPLSAKLLATARYIVPLGLIVFLVTGVIFLGIASPSEAAATGAFGCFILAAAYGRLNWGVIKKSVGGTLQITVMSFWIVAGARTFGEILAYSGIGPGVVELATGLPLSPIFVIVAMMIIVLIMGMFMTPSAIILITIPLFMPIVKTLGFDTVWFALIYLINVEMAVTTPPFGLNLFAMKMVAPPGTTMGDCIRGALPFLGCDLIAMALIVAFPAIGLWLPSVMR